MADLHLMNSKPRPKIVVFVALAVIY
jgi:hypothetical protein